MSISDKAFGLLLINNYLEKWTINAEEGAAGTETMEINKTTTEAETAMTTEAETASGQGKKKKARKKNAHKKRDNTDSVDGAELELASSMHRTSWLKMTGHVQRPSKWKGS